MVKRLEMIEWLALGISTLLLVLVYLLVGLWPFAILAGIPAMAWSRPRLRRTAWASSAVMVFLLGITAFGLARQIAIPFLLINSIPILVFWDLTSLSAGIPDGQPDRFSVVLFARHMRWLGMVVALAALLLILVALIHLELSFGWIIALTLALVFGFVVLVRKLSQTA